LYFELSCDVLKGMKFYKHNFRKIRRINQWAFEGNPGCLDSTSHTMTPMY